MRTRSTEGRVGGSAGRLNPGRGRRARRQSKRLTGARRRFGKLPTRTLRITRRSNGSLERSLPQVAISILGSWQFRQRARPREDRSDVSHVHITSKGEIVGTLFLDEQGHVADDGSPAAHNAIDFTNHGFRRDDGQAALDAIVIHLDRSTLAGAHHCRKEITACSGGDAAASVGAARGICGWADVFTRSSVRKGIHCHRERKRDAFGLESRNQSEWYLTWDVFAGRLLGRAALSSEGGMG